MANRKVTRIEPLEKLPGIQKVVLHKKVAAYVRVSTESEEQLGSFEAQRDYYEKYIVANPNWEFVGIYSDEGISGVNTKSRDGFKNMVADALAGKIGLIVTKSLSRFARNTVDALKTIRALKEKNKEVYFEKEDIHTLDSKGELLIIATVSTGDTFHHDRFNEMRQAIGSMNSTGIEQKTSGNPILADDLNTLRDKLNEKI